MQKPHPHLPLATLAGGLYSLLMSVATLQQIGQDLPSWVALAQHGETVAITQAGPPLCQCAGLISPPAAEPSSGMLFFPLAPHIHW